MFAFILCLILFLIIDFVAVACLDDGLDLNVSLPDGREPYMPCPSQIIKPSSELSITSKRDFMDCIDQIEKKTDEYVKDVVIPASQYFELRCRLRQYSDDVVFCYTAPIFHFIGLFCITIKTFPNEDYGISAFWHGVICFIILIVFAIVITFIFNLIYKHTLKIDGFRFNEEYFKSNVDEAVRYYSYYGIREIDAINNRIIYLHKEYLESTKNRVIIRHKLSNALSIIALIAFFACIALYNS
jgi:hypothetical protein